MGHGVRIQKSEVRSQRTEGKFLIWHFEIVLRVGSSFEIKNKK